MPSILHVEDHPDTRDLVPRLLGLLGYEVVSVGTGGEALEVTAGRHFTVALLDIGLPDMNGCELLRRLGDRLPLQAIAFTGHGSAHELAGFLAAGFDDVLVKPVGFDTLERTVQRAFGRLTPRTTR